MPAGQNRCSSRGAKRAGYRNVLPVLALQYPLDITFISKSLDPAIAYEDRRTTASRAGRVVSRNDHVPDCCEFERVGYMLGAWLLDLAAGLHVPSLNRHSASHLCTANRDQVAFVAVERHCFDVPFEAQKRLFVEARHAPE